jgi:hypothetical protein
MSRNKKPYAEGASNETSGGARRATRAVYFLILAAVFGGLLYALTQRSDAPADRNVPGATTGAGKAAVTD